jgi:hypothetical protein
MKHAAGLADDHECGQNRSRRVDHIVDGKKNLLGDEADVVGEIFERVD